MGRQSSPTSRSFGRFCSASRFYSASRIVACHFPDSSSKLSASSSLVELTALKLAQL
jgi:hypothetical protein